MSKKKILTLSKVMPKRHPNNSVRMRMERQKHGRDLELLDRCQQAWNNLSSVRETRERTKNYCYGDQWGDVVRVYKNGCWYTMTEREYMESRNTVPLSNNIMVSILNSIVGLYAKQGTEPVCFARTRDSVGISDMMSATMQCNWQTTGMEDLLKTILEDYLIGGQAFIEEVWDEKDMEMPDSWSEYREPDHMFWVGGSDPRHNDLSLIGYLADVSREDLYKKFATEDTGLSIDDLKKIFYLDDIEDNGYGIQTNEQNTLNNLSFNTTNKGSHYVRVIEVWTTETKMRLQCHDPIAKNANDAFFRVDLEDEAMIESLRQKNRDRQKQCLEQGIPEKEIPYITSKEIADKYWYYTILAPDGTVLLRGETPYDYKCHPFTMKLFPFVNGEIHPFMSNVIDQQRYINRLIIMNDMAIRSSAKGIWMVPKTVLDGMQPEQWVEQVTEFDGMAFYTPKPNMPQVKPEIITSNAVNIGTNELLQIELNLIREVTNVSGALQGKTPSAGTSAARYAQESQNATTSLFSILKDMEIFTEKVANKKCYNIKQFYEDGRIIYDKSTNSTIEYDRLSVRDVKFKISIKNAAATATYQTQINDELDKLLQMGAINVVQYLQNLNAPFADKLLQSVQAQASYMQQMAEQQAAIAQQQGGGVVGQDGIVQGANQQAVSQAQNFIMNNNAA